MNRQKALWIAGYIALGVMATFTAIILYWLLSPPKEVLSVNPHPIVVLTEKTHPDGLVLIRYNYCKNASATGRLVISLVGEDVQLTLPITTEPNPKGCEDNVEVPLPIPAQATPGRYHFHFRVTYQVNPLRTIIQDLDTEEFSVE